MNPDQAVGNGDIIWISGTRWVALCLASGKVRNGRCSQHIPPGSRLCCLSSSEGNATLALLPNGCSQVLQVEVPQEGGAEIVMKELSAPGEGRRFRSSLGSRMVKAGRSLLLCGTPNDGAHDLWCFDLEARRWEKMAPARHAILSSATTVCNGNLIVLGGWSKRASCHGYLQIFCPRSRQWTIASGWVPWRRPGAATVTSDTGGLLVALGWLEATEACVGTNEFHLYKRNGGAQNRPGSSSRLLRIHFENTMDTEEIGRLPKPDSFESTGELYMVPQISSSVSGGGSVLICIGRDHLQYYNVALNSWVCRALPKELKELDDAGASSWQKHCGSWAVTVLTRQQMQGAQDTGKVSGSYFSAFHDMYFMPSACVFMAVILVMIRLNKFFGVQKPEIRMKSETALLHAEASLSLGYGSSRSSFV
eukprot:gnl/MRDRNA2_/MRDRNA2_23609_c0_seq2.p1 gnl/MRDRNA2_/MRDRNA2_23609_c0~~gnl/MRDRNA2_/MRDRNA2_23609_c0_seq2.p1  ORF type:complete len:432 (+),score=50.94 gnl/MRDRNA2_/MRDRNA2_23609_c0_seq2:35-1297(+)